jgi:hypothetical protein
MEISMKTMVIILTKSRHLPIVIAMQAQYSFSQAPIFFLLKISNKRTSKLKFKRINKNTRKCLGYPKNLIQHWIIVLLLFVFFCFSAFVQAAKSASKEINDLENNCHVFFFGPSF